VEMNNKKVSDFDTFKELLKKTSDDNFVLLKVIRGKDDRFALMDRSKAQQEDNSEDLLDE
jgi:hypothetical protein